jgi:uncharacterized protein YukE
MHSTATPLGPVVLAAVRTDLAAIAGRLREDSAEVRGRAAAVAAAGDIAWRGRAAALFRLETGERALAVRATAEVLDDLAAAVERLAVAVTT